MINKNTVKEIVESWLEDKEYFLVDIEISADNKIVVEIDHADGKKYKGVLKSVDGNSFVLTTQEKVKVEGKKRPQLMDVDHTFEMNKVKYTKYLISFK